LKPLCPKCGEPVVHRGNNRGTQRWGHSGHSRRHTCKWQGTRPVGLEKAQAEGINRALVRRLHRHMRKAKRFVITAAQNATPVNAAFFASLLTYCKATRAELVVIPYRYKNPTSMWTDKAKDDDWWAAELVPYLYDVRRNLDKHLVLLADVKTQPTAVSPLQGFETLTGSKSAIIGHPKLELTTIATPHARLPKILTTTGAVTEKNYISAKAGKKAEHHHTFGACVVELEGGRFHMRQINAVRDGSFIDLELEYSGDKVSVPTGDYGLVPGDLHIRFIDPNVVAATWGEGGIVPALKPKFQVWNDVFDCNATNHHDRDKVFVKAAKYKAGMHNLERELDETFAFVDAHTRPGQVNVFVPSNHPNEHLERWMNETDPRKDPENCVFWARTFEVMYQSAKMGEGGATYLDPFNYWAERKLKSAKQAKLLKSDEGFQINGIEVGFHGHQGANGARGSRAQYAKIGVKTVIGHSHSPGIKDGAYQTGTSSVLRLAYNHGPSSWLHTHCVIYPNGKRTLINIIDGRWRA
jgi:hypothetical protein